MAGTLLFIHGTTVRDVSGSMRQLRAHAGRILEWAPNQVHAIEWGRAVGPQPLDITPSLPPEYSTRGVGGEISEGEQVSALWELLLADPSLELRLLAQGEQAIGGAGLIVGADPPDVVMDLKLADLDVAQGALEQRGFNNDDLDRARTALQLDESLSAAVSTVGDAEDAQLVTAVARSLTARMIAASLPQPGMAELVADLPAAAINAHARDELVNAMARAMGADTRGWFGDVLKSVGTKVAVAKRQEFMSPLSSFLRDVTFYLAHGTAMRDYIEADIRKHGGSAPVVVVGHSLGGIAAVDLLGDASVMGGDDPLKVDLLVTVGSQAPLLFLMDSLSSYSPRYADKQFQVPWLNIYNREDLLSFCAERVFVNGPEINDKEVVAGVPFPLSHSAYWGVDRVYELIRENLP
jgi:hypothetical protein